MKENYFDEIFLVKNCDREWGLTPYGLRTGCAWKKSRMTGINRDLNMLEGDGGGRSALGAW